MSVMYSLKFRLTAFILAIAMILRSLNIGTIVYAFSKPVVIELPNSIAQFEPEDIKILYEVEDLRTETEKVFVKNDGSYEWVSYLQPIHYYENGKKLTID